MYSLSILSRRRLALSVSEVSMLARGLKSSWKIWVGGMGCVKCVVIVCEGNWILDVGGTTSSGSRSCGFGDRS